MERADERIRPRAIDRQHCDPTTAAAYIAEEAHVAENTARDHLERLVDLNVLLEHDRDGAMLYAPDPLHTRLQTLRDLLTEHDRDGLIQLKTELQSRIEAWRDEYDAESPADVRHRAADSETAAQTRDLRTTANDWELVQYQYLTKFGTDTAPRPQMNVATGVSGR